MTEPVTLCRYSSPRISDFTGAGLERQRDTQRPARWMGLSFERKRTRTDDRTVWIYPSIPKLTMQAHILRMERWFWLPNTDPSIKSWNAAQETDLSRMGHTFSMECLSFHPSGTVSVSAHSDDTMTEFADHCESVWSVIVPAWISNCSCSRTIICSRWTNQYLARRLCVQ